MYARHRDDALEIGIFLFETHLVLFFSWQSRRLTDRPTAKRAIARARIRYTWVRSPLFSSSPHTHVSLDSTVIIH
jgi:hypothetical protein